MPSAGGYLDAVRGKGVPYSFPLLEGARVVKTYYCENFEKVVEGYPVPVVIAGGPLCETELKVMEFVHDGMQRGAISVNLGRNVWKNPYPVAMNEYIFCHPVFLMKAGK